MTRSLLLSVLLALAAAPPTRAQCLVHEDQKLVPQDGASGDRFGESADIAGSVLIAGAPGDDDQATGAGAAYVFRRIGGVWVEEAKLVAPDGTASDAFGTSVGVDGDVAVVGAPGDSDVFPAGGAVYVFERTGGSWIMAAKLAPAGLSAGDALGRAVAVHGDRLLAASADHQVGAADHSGAAYVFRRDPGGWVEEKTLAAADPGPFAYFGWSVDLAADRAIVGAIGGDGPGGFDSGAAYVFVRSGTSWTQEKKLVASDGAKDDALGVSVALRGDTAVAGAYRHGAVNDAGAAYVFRRQSGDWTETQKLVGHDTQASDRFGTKVAIAGDLLVVQAPLDDDTGSNSGVVFVFRERGAVWVEQTKLIGSDTNGSDSFGRGLAVSGGTVLAGSSTAGPNGASSGRGYVADLPDLSLAATPATVVPAAPLELFVCGGRPLAPMALVLTSANGAPTSFVLLIAAVDSAGRFGLALPAAPALGPLTLGLRAFAAEPDGSVLASDEESLTFP